MNDDKYPRVWQTNLIANLTGTFFRSGTPSPARYEASRNGNLKVVPADALVIERSELLDVSTNMVGNIRCGELVCAPENADYAQKVALEWLSVAEHLREHPPVGPGLVDQIRDIALAADATLTGTQVDTIARYFAARGVRVTEDGAK